MNTGIEGKRKEADSQLEKFWKRIESKYKVNFETYWDLHKWTVQNYTRFLEELYEIFEIIHSEPYKQVLLKTGPGFLDNEWFTGAKLNYAENLLRRRDDAVALICLDELGNEETVTFAEMFEEVKLYSAAFRKSGLKVGDCVACYMSNRKEAIFAMLATISIGAIWGGAVPFYGAKAAANIIRTLEPKFLITIDQHQANGEIIPTLEYLPIIVENTPTLEKVILVVTEEDTLIKDLTSVRNCSFLEEFLKKGRLSDGTVPDIVFEQLPIDHPICLNFTSGTTGSPKALVHSAGILLPMLCDAALSCNLKRGDVIFTPYPVGWINWDNMTALIALGVTTLLYCGSMYCTVKGCNFWDILAKYKVNYVSFVTSTVDILEKKSILPSPGSDLSCLKCIEITGSPVKRQNFEYLKNVNKDTFISINYGATETFSSLAICYECMPEDTAESLVPTLGIDFHCFDSSGKSVVGEQGEAVVCSRAINFPIGVWKDENKSKVTALYLSDFPGAWKQHDQCWINPETKGIIVTGRSDDTLKQNGERFAASDIYKAIHSLVEIEDYICVSQRKYNNDCRAVLFLKMRPGLSLTSETKTKIEKAIENHLWEICVPELITDVPEIPYNINGKRAESLVRKIIETNSIPSVMNIKNPECLKYFMNIPEILKYNKI